MRQLGHLAKPHKIIQSSKKYNKKGTEIDQLPTQMVKILFHKDFRHNGHKESWRKAKNALNSGIWLMPTNNKVAIRNRHEQLEKLAHLIL